MLGLGLGLWKENTSPEDHTLCTSPHPNAFPRISAVVSLSGNTSFQVTVLFLSRREDRLVPLSRAVHKFPCGGVFALEELSFPCFTK